MNLLLLLLALPLCLAQFSIQGPSDGNRVAQGLKVSDDRGIEYTDQNESQGSGDFTIQGATDGNTNFRIQGATDGHSNFQIQGPSDGGAEKYNFQGAQAAGADRYNYQDTGAGQSQNFNIQGATDGHSQSIIQGPYDANQGPGKSLQYNDPSGLRVNWKSYDRQPRPRQQAQPQYYSDNAAPASAPQRAQPRQRAYAQPRAQAAQAPVAQPPVVQAPVYKPYDNAPQQIKELLQFQAQIPYLNSIPPAFRYEQLAAAQAQGQQSHNQYQNEAAEPAPAPQRPAYRTKQRPQHRQKRQAQEQKQGQPQYRRLEQPPAEAQIQYSSNLPSNLQQLLKFQSQIPYVSVIPEQYRYDVESAVQNQAKQVRAHYENLGRQPQGGQGGQGHGRQRRQAQHQQQNAGDQQQYRRISQPPAEPQPQYSTNLPGHLEQLLKYQAATPHNIIANQIVYRPDKPYVPQPIQSSPSIPQQAQYQGQGGAHQSQGGGYQGQGGAYQGQGAAYQGQGAAYQSQGDAYQAQGSAYQGQASNAYPQSQLLRQPGYPQGYGQAQGGVRPVTENQY